MKIPLLKKLLFHSFPSPPLKNPKISMMSVAGRRQPCSSEHFPGEQQLEYQEAANLSNLLHKKTREDFDFYEGEVGCSTHDEAFSWHFCEIHYGTAHFRNNTSFITWRENTLGNSDIARSLGFVPRLEDTVYRRHGCRRVKFFAWLSVRKLLHSGCYHPMMPCLAVYHLVKDLVCEYVSSSVRKWDCFAGPITCCPVRNPSPDVPRSGWHLYSECVGQKWSCRLLQESGPVSTGMLWKETSAAEAGEMGGTVVRALVAQAWGSESKCRVPTEKKAGITPSPCSPCAGRDADERLRACHPPA